MFRHEIAYVLGQIQSAIAIPELAEALRNAHESGMVRHECAEALGAIATPECRELLEEYAKDEEVIYKFLLYSFRITNNSASRPGELRGRDRHGGLRGEERVPVRQVDLKPKTIRLFVVDGIKRRMRSYGHTAS